MADKSRSDTSKTVKNPLLTGAESGFPFENFSASTFLMPVSRGSSSIFSEDVGEPDSFLGQDAPATSFSRSTQPGVNRPPTTTHPEPKLNTIPSSLQQIDLKPPEGYSAGPFSGGSLFPQTQFQPQASPFDTSAFQGTTQPPHNQIFQNSTSGARPFDPAAFPGPTHPPPHTQIFPSIPSQTPPFNSQQHGPTSHFQTLVPLSDSSSFFSSIPVNQGPRLSPNPTPPLFHPSPAASPYEYGQVPLAAGPPIGVCPPNHIPPIPLPVATVAPLAGTTNTYRLSQKRPVYAQPPGLSRTTPVVTAFAPTVPDLSITPTSTFSTPPVSNLTATPISTFSIPSNIPSFPLPAAETNAIPSFNAPSVASIPYTVDTKSYAPSVPLSSTNYGNSSILTPYSSVGPPSPLTMAATMTPTQLPSSGPAIYHTSPMVAELDPSEMVLPPSFNNLAQSMIYRPVYHHWFYKKECGTKALWEPFSMTDSLALEKAFVSTDISPDTRVATDGGRYDVGILRRQRWAAYWTESPTEVRRCSWFYKGAADSRFVPYDESLSTRLEEEYKTAATTNVWHRRVEFPNGEAVVLHGPNVIVHFLHSASPDTWGNTPQTQTRPRIVKRGVDEFAIDDGEPEKVDHVLFLVHGIGSVCDLKFRSVEEVVNEFRRLSLQLVQSHFRESSEMGTVSRVEVLPVSWHGALHGEDTGIDRKLKSITLHSIPKLRDFTNDTLLDILFYTSPVYCQTIMKTVGTELNRLYSLFQERNPDFRGGVSLSGHSLGSLILFDLLYHQKPPVESPQQPEQTLPSKEASTEPESKEDSNEDTLGPLAASLKVIPPLKRRSSQKINYVMGDAGTGQPFINYPQLNFHPRAFFALGSPIGMFVTVRGIEILGESFHLPTCPGFFNIFHPFDPVAYRIETLINPDLASHRPVLIPHHKGRKRMHLELKETMARVGADLKQRLVDSVRSTWNTVYQYAMFHRNNDQELEQEVDKVLEEQMSHNQDADSSISEGEVELDLSVGELNAGRRVDYVLQEAPLESFNEYLSALHGHLCYWESEDTMLMILKEVYSSMGIRADSQTLQHQIPLEPSQPLNNRLQDSEPSVPIASYPVNSASSRFPLASKTSALDLPSTADSASEPAFGMDPTAPILENRNLGPPPMGGFVRK